MEKIKNIYTKLSNGKVINDNSSIIKASDFNSVMADRFRAELKKMDIKWDGSDTSLEKLTGTAAPATQSKPNLADNYQKEAVSLNSSNEVGIDIQHINEMPVCEDFWEDAFYQTNFSKEEIAYCASKNEPLHSFAGLYAAKEALIKCSATIKWDDIVIEHNEHNKPFYKNYLISISHSGEFAVAVAIKMAPAINNTVIHQPAITKPEKEAKRQPINTLSLIALFISLAVLGYLILKENKIL